VQFTLNAETAEEADHEVEIEWPHHPAATRDAITRAAAEIGKARAAASGATQGDDHADT